MGEYLTAEELRARGWTASLINRFLGPPELVLHPNPHRGASRLYGSARVEGMERTAELRAALQAVEVARAKRLRTSADATL